MREHWPDGWFAAGFLPRPRRAAAKCVYAVLGQLARVVSGSEGGSGSCSCGPGDESGRVARAMLDHLWRGEPTGRADLDGFAAVAAKGSLQRGWFEAWIEAGLRPVPPRVATWSRLRSQLEATTGPLASITAALLGGSAEPRWLALHTAIALGRVIESIPYDAAVGRLRLPLDDLVAAGLSDRDVLRSTGDDPRLEQVLHAMIQRARTLLRGGAKAVAGIADRRTRAAVAVLVELEQLRLIRAGAGLGRPAFAPRGASLRERLAVLPRAMRRARL